MNITKEDVDALNAVINVEIVQDDYEEQVNGVLRQHRKNASMPGFRPGKVPFGLIRKMYGKAVLVEEMNKILSESLHKFIVDNDLQVLGNPMPVEGEENDLDNQTDFKFSYNIGLAPEFEVGLSDKDKFDFYKIKVDDALIDKYTLDLQKRYGSMSQAQETAETDMVNGDFVELNEDGSIKEGGIMHKSTIVIDYVEDADTKKSLIGLKEEDTVDLDPEKVSKGPADQAAMLGVSKEQLDSVSNLFRFKIGMIHRMNPSDLNQEFFDKVFGPDVVTSEEEFRGKVGEQLERMLSNDSERKLQKDVSEALLDRLDLQLPDEFLKRWLLESKDNDLDAEKLEAEYDNYAKSLKWQLIENKIIAENDIKVEPDEAIERAKNLIRQQLAQYGQSEIDDEQLTGAAHNLLGKEEDAKNIYSQLFDEKTLALYKERLKLKDKEVSFDDFVKLATGKSAKKGLLGNLGNLMKF